MVTLHYHLLSVCDRHSYLVVFETAAAPAFVAVEVLGFVAVDAADLLVVPTNTQKNRKNIRP